MNVKFEQYVNTVYKLEVKKRGFVIIQKKIKFSFFHILLLYEHKQFLTLINHDFRVTYYISQYKLYL